MDNKLEAHSLSIVHSQYGLLKKIEVIKQFKDNYPQTICKITRQGVKAFETYVKNLQQYIKK